MKERVHYLTPDGLDRAKEELALLTTVKRREIADRLQFAIQQGDITENADYEVAKQDQAMIEGRIKHLEDLIIGAQIIQYHRASDMVEVGCRVTVSEEGEPAETYTIVGPSESAPDNGLISHESPVGAALLGKRVGDVATVVTPGGQFCLTVLEIE
jgi:transcription elongation factor GreA